MDYVILLKTLNFNQINMPETILENELDLNIELPFLNSTYYYFFIYVLK